MDELLFRSSQNLEHLHVQLSLAASHSKEVLQQCTQQGRIAALQVWNSSYSGHVRENFNAAFIYLINLSYVLREKIGVHLDPQMIYYNLVRIFGKKWSQRDVLFFSAGFICGGLGGVAFATTLRRSKQTVHFMKAVQCTNYLGIECATVLEDAIAPSDCGENEIIVNVKAASVQVIDAKICAGYGKIVRKSLQGLYRTHSKTGFPVTLGRDCTGIITDIGSNVKRLERGEEVWLTVPFWCEGTLSQTVSVPEYRVGRKPKNVGYEGACSLPYAGCVALHALAESGITKENAPSKRILVVGGCTPVGCVLIQVLSHWRADVTASCYKKAVPVARALDANDIIMLPTPLPNAESKSMDSEPELYQDSLDVYLKELECRKRFDAIIITRHCGVSTKSFEKFCKGTMVSTLPQERASDSYGLLARLFIGGFLRLKYLMKKISGDPLCDFDEAHMCYVTLDKLSDLVENGHLQTVVDKVFHPQDIEFALSHIQSPESIGSTVITFR